MKTQLLDLSKDKPSVLADVDATLSFSGFISHIRKMAEAGGQGKHELLQSVLDRFAATEEQYGPLGEDTIAEYQTALYYTYNLLVPTLADEDKTLWALGLPLGKKIFYGTDALYGLLMQHHCADPIRLQVVGAESDDGLAVLRSVYAFLLERLYGIPLFEGEPPVYSYINHDTGLPEYFAVRMDHTFLSVKAKGKLPPLGDEDFSRHTLQVDCRAMLDRLPLGQFQFEGFSIITLTDITLEHVTENIRAIVAKSADGKFALYREALEESLKILAGNSHARFSLLPISEANGKQELGQAVGSVPLYYNDTLTGVLEIYADGPHAVDRLSLARLSRAAPLLAQLLHDCANHFNTQVEAVIKEKFTSLQPAVQWKFREAALDYLRKMHFSDMQPDQPNPVIGTIQFKNVFPLYGAIDIRNSTSERNRALVSDVRLQLDHLLNVLEAIQQLVNLAVVDEMLFNCTRWHERLDTNPIDTLHLKLKEFFERDVSQFLKHFSGSDDHVSSLIRRYEEETNPETGLFHSHRRSLESSMALVNKAINGYLELLNREIQQSYPCYFEKFRTDGVEYDIYIGQSITPDRPFNPLYLQNVRIWQLSSMAAIAQITDSLLSQMETPLETTQLIFVNSSDIDISFRADERRFDVEGSYNIRHHVIKKRIDKVLVKGSGERLTQPRKIALVYNDNREKEEYLGYISYLQNKELLLDDLEELELEELQGISGLRALRIGVRI